MTTGDADRVRHQRVKEILQRVLDAAPHERDAVLDAACEGDASLRREAESLLAGSDDVSDFLKSPFDLKNGPLTIDDAELDLTGSRVGAYRLERLLGRGGMGAVYLASRDDGEFAKRVAIKVIRPSMATPHLLKRFRVERQILASIEHPHIARFLDGGTTENGLPFFIMEYVEGDTLADVLKRGPLSLPRALRLASELADALALIHSKKLVFRDLKPSNLMFDAQASVKVLDFGIARITRAEEIDPATGQTQPGWIIGSPRYMSPEQASGAPAAAPSDVFSFGVVLYEALTGRLPFDGVSLQEYYQHLISAEPRGLPLTVPRGVRQLVERCLRKAPSERYASGAELVAAVRALGAGGRGRTAAWIAVATGVAILVGSLRWFGGGPQVVDRPVLGASQPVVTWASDETNPRVSPDMRWVSFISDRDGVAKLCLRDRASGEERVIAAAGGDVVGHEWAPSSERVAYLTATGAGSFLNISDITGGARADSFPIDANAILVRWIGDGIYYAAGESLWRFDLSTLHDRPDESRSLAKHSREVTIARGTHRLRSVDVSADERHIVFTTYGADFNRLWYGDIDGKNAVALTDTRIDPRFPRWKGRGPDEFVYVSDENGQADIWLMDVPTRHRRPLTSSGAREAGLGVSDDGSLVVYQQIVESATLASLDPQVQTPAIKVLTADSLSDLAPSASGSGQLVGFQRAKNENLGVSVYSATVRINRDGFATDSEVIGDGYSPEVSPGGEWVAYLTTDRVAPTSTLRLFDVASKKTEQVSEYFAKPGYRQFPMAWTKVNFAWSPTRPEFFFVSLEPGHRQAIVRVTLPTATSPMRNEKLFEVDDPTADVKDLRLSKDGRRLAYLLTSASRAVSELHVVELDGGAETIPVKEGSTVTLTCLGWTSAEAILILRSDSRMSLVDVLLASRTRQGRGDFTTPSVGQLRGLDPGNLSLDPARRILYFTRTDRTGHSLHAFMLDQGKERLLRPAELHSGVFSGIRVLGDGKLLFSIQKRNSDIYSNKLDR